MRLFAKERSPQLVVELWSVVVVQGHYVLVHIDVTARTVSLLDSLHGKKHGLGPGEAPPILDRVVW